MTALTKARNTPRRDLSGHDDPVLTNAVIHAGALVVLDANGYAKPGVTAAGLKARGRAEASVDNTGGASGAVKARIATGVFRFENLGADAIARSHIGGTAYIADDQTVAATDGTGTRSAAGRIVDVDSAGVWVEIR